MTQVSKKEGEKKNIKDKIYDLRLSAKISLAVGILLTFMLLLLLAISVTVAGRALTESVDGEIQGIASENSVVVQNIVDGAISVADNLRDYIDYQYSIFESYDGRKEKSMVYDSMLQAYNADLEDYLVNTAWAEVGGSEFISSLSVAFEPGCFDAGIMEYSIYVNEENAKNKTVSTLGPYSEYGSEEYYKRAVTTQDFYFTDPFVYNEKTLVTAAFPIISNGVSQGAVMVDINIDKFDVIDVVNEKYPTLYGNIITKEGIYIYDVAGIEWSGADMEPYFYRTSEYDAMMEKMQLNEPFQIDTHREDGRKVKRYCYPIDLGNDIWWSQSILDYSDANKAVLSLVLVMAAIVLVVLVVIILVTAKLIVKFLKPVGEVENAAKELAKGNLDVVITYDSGDEIGRLSNSMRSTCSFMKQVIGDANRLLQEISEGNFDVHTACEDAYIGEFRGLLISMRKLNTRLSDALGRIHEASEQVSAGAGNMAEAAQSLAEGATDQAGAVEELLATVTSLTEGISRTSMSIEETERISGHYAEMADRSGSEMKELVGSMSRMSETSKKIGSIIAEIEEIASQTNLLSLNASIEAARAGEAGRGFAVVATQIGKLAEESAQSAVNTRELILTAIGEVDEGSRIAEETAGTIEEVVKGIKTIAQSAKEVSEQMLAQAEAMKQAEEGVNQISEVVQSNSANAEESSATSEELSAQATSLDELVGKFKLKQ